MWLKVFLVCFGFASMNSAHQCTNCPQPPVVICKDPGPDGGPGSGCGPVIPLNPEVHVDPETVRLSGLCDIEEETSVEAVLNKFDDAYKEVEQKYPKEYLKEIGFENTLYEEAPRDNYTAHFVIVGGSTAGCALANRLSENKEWRVVLLEKGPGPTAKQDIPSLMMMWQTRKDFQFVYEPQDNFGLGTIDRKLVQPTAPILGGSSQIDYLNYVRGSVKDFQALGDDALSNWCKNTVVKYWKKIENCTVMHQNWKVRGHKGPVKIEDIAIKGPYTETFLKACQELGFKVHDINGCHQIGASYVQARTRRNLRVSSEKAYIRPILGRTNLHVWTGCQAIKILYHEDAKCASGVQFVHKNKPYKVWGEHEVIITEDPYNSAKLLMLSGIGPKEELQKCNIKKVKHLPVGKRLYNRIMYPGLFLKIPPNTKPAAYEAMFDSANMDELVGDGHGALSRLSGQEAVLLAQSPNSYLKEVDKDFPDVEVLLINSGITDSFKGKVFRDMFNIREDFYDEAYRSFESPDFLVVTLMLLKPLSKGHVSLGNCGIDDPLVIHGNFFRRKEDSEALAWAAKLAKKIFDGDGFKKANARLVNMRIKECEGSPEDSWEYWDCCFRHASYIWGNPTGTCPMGSDDDEDAVVNFDGTVKDVEHLRVVGTSIMPQGIVGESFPMEAMIAERIADLIKEQHGYEGDGEAEEEDEEYCN